MLHSRVPCSSSATPAHFLYSIHLDPLSWTWGWGQPRALGDGVPCLWSRSLIPFSCTQKVLAG
jgi:hypothetical protein